MKQGQSSRPSPHDTDAIEKSLMFTNHSHALAEDPSPIRTTWCSSVGPATTGSMLTPLWRRKSAFSALNSRAKKHQVDAPIFGSLSGLMPAVTL